MVSIFMQMDCRLGRSRRVSGIVMLGGEVVGGGVAVAEWRYMAADRVGWGTRQDTAGRGVMR